MQINDRVQINDSFGQFIGETGTVVALLPYDQIEGGPGLRPPAGSTQFIYVNLDAELWPPITDGDIEYAQLVVGIPDEVAALSRVHRMALIVSDTHLSLLSVTDEADNEVTV